MEHSDNDSHVDANPFVAIVDSSRQRSKNQEEKQVDFKKNAEMKVKDVNGNDDVKQELVDVSSQGSAKFADFCEECGTAFTNLKARFCKKCGAPRELL